MEATTAKIDVRKGYIDIHVSLDVLHIPEALPLTLRNIVVELSRFVPLGDRKTFVEFMTVVGKLDAAFKSLHDD